jgi:hypothetical protein
VARDNNTPTAATNITNPTSAICESAGTGTGAGTAFPMNVFAAYVPTANGAPEGCALTPIKTVFGPREVGENATMSAHPDVVMTKAPGTHVVPVESMRNIAASPAAKKVLSITTGASAANAGARTKLTVTLLISALTTALPRLKV